MGLFVELSSILILTTILAFLAKLLRLPMLVGYIVSGIVIGPLFLNLLTSTETLELFSKLGIATLLFIVGLHLSPKVLKEVGRVSVIGGLAQVILTSLAGFGISRFLGFDFLASFYIAIGITLSSTIIVLKLLSDKGDLNSLYGKITIGLLMIQDVIATALLLLLPLINQPQSFASAALPLLLKGIALALILFLFSKFLLAHMSRLAASSTELLFLFSLSYGLGVASLFQVLGFSVETGALIAGVSLSITPFAHEIGSRLRPLRDFFIVIFFVLLGAQLTFANLAGLIVPAIVLSVFVLFISPLIVLVVMNLLGFSKRIGFLTGLGLAQISEFSLILAQLGFRLGHLNQDVMSLITIIALVTIVVSTYLVLQAEHLYSLLTKPLSFLELIKKKPGAVTDLNDYDTILFGHHRVGQDFVKLFKKLKYNFLVIDFDPQVISHLKAKNIPCLFGDAQDAEFLKELNLPKLKLVVSTIPDFDTNLFLVKTIKSHNSKTITLILSHSITDAKKLYDAGASYVLMPHYLGAKYATRLIKRFKGSTRLFSQAKRSHMQFLDKHLADI